MIVFNSEEAEQTHLSLRIFHPDLDPDQVTHDLGLTPEMAVRKGEQRTSKGRTYAPYETGFWTYGTEAAVKSNYLSDHLDVVFKLIEGKEAIFERYHQDGCEMEIFVFWFKEKGIGGGPLVSWPHMQKLSAFKLDLSFDIYS